MAELRLLHHGNLAVDDATGELWQRWDDGWRRSKSKLLLEDPEFLAIETDLGDRFAMYLQAVRLSDRARGLLDAFFERRAAA